MLSLPPEKDTMHRSYSPSRRSCRVSGLRPTATAGKLIAAQLYGVASWDLVALSVATVALAICSFLAALIPANRAASISPMNALRIE